MDEAKEESKHENNATNHAKLLPLEESDEEAPPEREQWSGKLDFLMACLSFAVGLGSLWRFPYLVYRNGGGAFLIPYLVMNVVAGLPLFLIEMSLGQFSSSGLVKVWRLCPLFKGVGFGMLIVSVLLAPYYNMVIGWALVFLVNSFTAVLPWSHCCNEWNSADCAVTTIKGENATIVDCNLTFDESTSGDKISPADEFFHNRVVSITGGFHDVGVIEWRLVLALMVAWILTCLVLIRGPKSSGKVAYFTAIFPYIVLTILLVRAVTLPGHEKGIKYFITPNWTTLSEPSVWGDAAVQVAFSLSLGWGGILTLASYKAYHTNVIRDTIMVTGITAFTAMFCGFVIFAVLGVMAEAIGVEVEDVASQGAGLAFIVYPEAVTKMPVSPLWSILFFLMILSLGIGTQIATVTTIVTTATDSSPLLYKYRLQVTIGISIMGFLLGLPLCSGAGMYILQLLDNYVATWSVLIICIIECLVVSYVYGVNRFLDDIHSMVGYRPCGVWKFCWAFLTPAILVIIVVLSFIEYKTSSYRDYVFPSVIDKLGFVFSFASVACIPTVAVLQVLSKRGSFVARLKELLHPSPDWGPLMPIDKWHRKNFLGVGGRGEDEDDIS